MLIALGTHQPMSEAALARHLGYEEGRLEDDLSRDDGRQPRVVGPGDVRQPRHHPGVPARRAVRGPADAWTSPVLLNRAVVEHDVALVVGPVLPHEVVGISGGNKYFFPGVAGQEIIDVSHWIGALITSRRDHRDDRGITPVRALINEGASLVPGREARRSASWARPAASDLHSVSFGDTDRVLGQRRRRCAPRPTCTTSTPRSHGCCRSSRTMYEDIWTGAKGFYKLEPVVADGGEVILYAPHITEISDEPPGDPRDRLPLPRLLREAVGPVLAHPLGHARPLDPPARRRHLRRRDRRGAAAGQGHPRHRDPRGACAGRPTSATSTSTRSTSRPRRPTPRPSSCPTPVRCSSGCAEPVEPAHHELDRHDERLARRHRSRRSSPPGCAPRSGPWVRSGDGDRGQLRLDDLRAAGCCRRRPR